MVQAEGRKIGVWGTRTEAEEAAAEETLAAVVELVPDVTGGRPDWTDERGGVWTLGRLTLTVEYATLKDTEQ